MLFVTEQLAYKNELTIDKCGTVDQQQKAVLRRPIPARHHHTVVAGAPDRAKHSPTTTAG